MTITNALPAPLTPENCDLRDFQFMPLDVLRLRDADLSAVSTGEEFRCAILLYCAAWHQVPAASLPDDDMILSRLAGFGRVVKEWKKVKAVALRGWIKCEDGRLYHPVVAEKANRAWCEKVEQRWRTECARIKKLNQRNGTDLPTPELSEFVMSPQCPSGHPPYVPEDNPHLSPQCPSGHSIQEIGTGTGIVIKNNLSSHQSTGDIQEADEDSDKKELAKNSIVPKDTPSMSLGTPAPKDEHVPRDIHGLSLGTQSEKTETQTEKTRLLATSVVTMMRSHGASNANAQNQRLLNAIAGGATVSMFEEAVKKANAAQATNVFSYSLKIVEDWQQNGKPERFQQTEPAHPKGGVADILMMFKDKPSQVPVTGAFANG